MYVMGADLGQSQDYTALSILEYDLRPGPAGRQERHYQLRYLHRPPLGTSYPAVVQQVVELLDRPPLSRMTPLVVDKTGVGAPVVDMFRAAGIRPRAVGISGGTVATRKDPFNMNVPKRELASLLVALFQGQRLKIAKSLGLGEVLKKELQNFKVKVTLAGNDTYEAWRESDHDDLVLSVALACWYVESGGGDKPLPFALVQGQAKGWSIKR